jgi:hypothetical protein
MPSLFGDFRFKYVKEFMQKIAALVFKETANIFAKSSRKSPTFSPKVG